MPPPTVAFQERDFVRQSVLGAVKRVDFGLEKFLVRWPRMLALQGFDFFYECLPRDR